MCKAKTKAESPTLIINYKKIFFHIKLIEALKLPLRNIKALNAFFSSILERPLL